MCNCRPAHWGSFVDQLEVLAGNSLVLRSLKDISPESLLPREWKTRPKMKLSAVQLKKDSWSSLWIPIDLILEDAMDGHHVMAASAVELLTGMLC